MLTVITDAKVCSFNDPWVARLDSNGGTMTVQHWLQGHTVIESFGACDQAMFNRVARSIGEQRAQAIIEDKQGRHAVVPGSESVVLDLPALRAAAAAGEGADATD